MKLTSHDLPRSHWRRVASENGICLKTFQARIARGWSPQRAATQSPREGSSWRYSHDADVSRQHGLYWESVKQWRYRNNDNETPAEEIAEKLVAKRQRVTLKQRALDAGLHPATVWSRINLYGWSEEKALSVPPIPHSESMRRNRKRGKPCE